MSIKSLTDGPDVWPKKPIVELEPPHVDERGEIIPLVDAPIQSAVMITSKKGTVRANHYHKTSRNRLIVGRTHRSKGLVTLLIVRRIASWRSGTSGVKRSSAARIHHRPLAVR